MRLIIILLLTFTLIPTASLAEGKRVIDIYQQQLEDLRITHAKLNTLSKDAVKRAAHIERLIVKYDAALKTATQDMAEKYKARLKQLEAKHAKTEAALKTATQEMEDKYKAQIEQLKADHAKIKAAYLKRLEATAELADYHYQSAKKTDVQIKLLLTQLGMSAEQVLKLTEANLALQREVKRNREEMERNRKEMDAIQSLHAFQSSHPLWTSQGHTSYVWSVAFSPDGRYALSGSNDKTLKLWDVSSGQAVRTFQGHSHVYSVAFSPDGRYALSGSGDKTLKLWDVLSGQAVRTWKGHTSAVYSVAFSPDGRYALSGSSDQTFKLWDMYSWLLLLLAE